METEAYGFCTRGSVTQGPVPSGVEQRVPYVRRRLDLRVYCCAYISTLPLVGTSVLSLVLPGIDAKNGTDRVNGTSRRHHAVRAFQRQETTKRHNQAVSKRRQLIFEVVVGTHVPLGSVAAIGN